MPASVKIEYTGHIPKMPRRDQNNIIRDSYEDVGEQFYERNLPRRFTFQGSRTLAYSRRTAEYQARKRRLLRHFLPFVWSGDTRDRALSRLTRIVARAKKGVGSVVLKVNAPTLNFHPKYREEFERVATIETGPLERKLEQSATKRFDDYKESQSFSG